MVPWHMYILIVAVILGFPPIFSTDESAHIDNTGVADADADADADTCGHGVTYLNVTGLRRLYGTAVTSVQRYLFLGDSTTRDSFHAFGQIFDYVCVDQSNTNLKEGGGSAFRNKCTTRVKRTTRGGGGGSKNKKKNNNGIISTAEFFPFGRKQGWKRSGTKAYRQTMKGYVAQLGQDDVLIFNMGLHFDETATTHDFTSFYSQALKTLVSDLGLTGYSHKKRCQNISEAPADPYLPTVLWRETLPQHFNSSNGHYPFHNTSDRRVCVPLTAARRSGQNASFATSPLSLSSSSFSLSSPTSSSLLLSTTATTKHTTTSSTASLVTSPCDPSCLPANWQNHIASALMRELCIPTLPMWGDFSCLHDQHSKAYGDCSHLTEAGNHILIGKLLHHLFVEKKSTTLTSSLGNSIADTVTYSSSSRTRTTSNSMVESSTSRDHDDYSEYYITLLS